MSVSEEFRKYLIHIHDGNKPDPNKFELKIETAKEYCINMWLLEQLRDKVVYHDGYNKNFYKDIFKYYARFAWIIYYCFCKMPFSMTLTDELNNKYNIHYTHPECHRNLTLTNGEYMQNIYTIQIGQYDETYRSEILKFDSYKPVYYYSVNMWKLENAGKKILRNFYYKYDIPLNGRASHDVIKEIFNQQEVSPYLLEEPKPVEEPLKFKINEIVEKLKKLNLQRDQLMEQLHTLVDEL